MAGRVPGVPMTKLVLPPMQDQRGHQKSDESDWGMSKKQQVQTILKNCIIFTANVEQPYFGSGAIAIENGRIIGLGEEGAVLGDFEAVENIDLHGGIVHPGYIDAHLHLLSVPFHSLRIDPDGQAANQVSYSSIKTQTDDASVTAFATSTAISCLKKGITLFAEPGTLFETDALAAAIGTVGSRAMVAAPYGWDDVEIFFDLMPGTMSDTLMQRAPADTKRVITQAKRELQRNSDPEARVKGYVCLYGLGSSSGELLEECVALARSQGVVFSQHDGYLPEYVSAEEARFGATGIARLAELNCLGADVSLTHLNVVRAEDAETIQASATNVLWSPMNALHRGLHLDHTCYHPQWHRDGVNVAIVSDSAMDYAIGSTGLAGLFLSGAVGNRLEPHIPFYMQTINAAKSLGIDRDLGSLEVGKRADIVVRKPKDMSEVPLSEMGSIIATSSAMMDVDRVLINGGHIMKGGQMVSLDEGEVLANSLSERQRILERVSK